MPRYIDADNIKLKGISVFDQNLEILIPLSDVRKSLQMTPTADVQEIRHGHWFILEYEYFTCSECGYYQPNGCDSTKEAKEKLAEGKVPKYCSECGARMDGDEE